LAIPPHDRPSAASSTYFLTTSVYGGRNLLQSDQLADLFLNTIFSYRDQKKFEVHEFVVMKNHIHLLITPGDNVTLEKAVQFIKGGFSHRVKKKLGICSEIWQRGYVDHRVRDARDFAQHRAYIHANPVRDHLAGAPEEFRYCSAYPGYVLDPAPQGLKPQT
jgi:putative transposase